MILYDDCDIIEQMHPELPGWDCLECYRAEICFAAYLIKYPGIRPFESPDQLAKCYEDHPNSSVFVRKKEALPNGDEESYVGTLLYVNVERGSFLIQHYGMHCSKYFLWSECETYPYPVYD